MRSHRPIHPSGLVAMGLAALLLLAAPGEAADPRWELNFDGPREAADAERLLDRLERAFSEVLEATPDAAEVRLAAMQLVAARETHTGQARATESARARIEEARARLERDERVILDRRHSAAWERLTAAEQAAMESKEDQYLGRIRAVTANREAEAARLEGELEPTRALLVAYAGSWGGLALERAIFEPQRITRLSGASWHRAMEAHAQRFNAYARANFGTTPCMANAASRPLRSHRIPTTDVPTVVRDPRGLTGPGSVASAPGATSPWMPGAPDQGPGPASPRLRDPIQDPGFDPVFPDERQRPDPMAPSGAPSGGRTEVHGGFVWHTCFADAAAEARRTGKLVYCLSTKPNCHMCEAVRDESVPSCLADMQRLCVGYVYDITNPKSNPESMRAETARVDGVLRRNLVGYSLMPLTGWVTPDLGWVHGFHGFKAEDDFRRELRRAQALRR